MLSRAMALFFYLFLFIYLVWYLMFGNRGIGHSLLICPIFSDPSPASSPLPLPVLSPLPSPAVSSSRSILKPSCHHWSIAAGSQTHHHCRWGSTNSHHGAVQLLPTVTSGVPLAPIRCALSFSNPLVDFIF